MHVLVVNDDGPPSQLSSPYVHSFVDELQRAGVTVSVVLPHVQRSWIGKAHFAHTTIKPTYFRPGALHTNDGVTHSVPQNDGGEEWILVDGTPATCVQIGLYHYFQEKGPIDMVISGPNHGRNSTALFSLSSGTVGGAIEGAICRKKSIALSFAHNSPTRDPAQIRSASQLSVRLSKHLYENWSSGVDFYNINLPLSVDHSTAKILYTNILPNYWTAGSYEEIEAPPVEEDGTQAERERKLQECEPQQQGQSEPCAKAIKHKHFRWAPKIADLFRTVDESEPGNDGWAVREGHVSVTPLKANFMHIPGFEGELTLSQTRAPENFPVYALVRYDDEYVQSRLLRALQRITALRVIEDINEVSCIGNLVQWSSYEDIDFDHVLHNPQTSLACSYIIRKALIRKHFLAHTIHTHVAKHSTSVLSQSFPESYPLELDYVEFLDEALDECFELRDSLLSNQHPLPESRCWWILKPSMSDRGQGIRIFSTIGELEKIFEDFEELEEDEEDDVDKQGAEEEAQATLGGVHAKENSVITSQLRHFLVQKYIHPPLILGSKRKFHIRTYVLAVGAIKVYVYRNMLALFAGSEYEAPWEASNDDLSGCLTNTCLKTGDREGSVQLFWELPETEMLSGDARTPTSALEGIWNTICRITGDLFLAAAVGQRIHFQALPNAFEVFGIDFMVDASLDVFLLEVNSYPDFKQTGDRLSGLIDGLFEGVVDVALKPFFSGNTEARVENMEKVLDIELQSW